MRKVFTIMLALILLVLPFLTSCSHEAVLEDGFEEGTSWFKEAWQDNESVTAEIISLEGRNVAHLIAGEPNDLRFCHEIDVAPNTHYRITCRIKTSDISGDGGANIAVVDSFAASTPITGTSNWQDVALVGKTGKDQKRIKVAVRIGNYGAETSGEAWFDALTFTKLDSAAGLEVSDFSNFNTSSKQNNNAYTAMNANDPNKVIHDWFSVFIILALVFGAIGLACYWLIVRPKANAVQLEIKKESPLPLVMILLGAFAFRAILAFIFLGHPTDINCFMYWGNAVFNNGPATFYTSGWSDYPPGYMYILAAMTGVARLFGLQYNTLPYAFIIKLPAILCDLAAAFIIYKLAEKRLPKKGLYLITAFIAFNPVMAFISGGWAQIDQVLTVLLLVSMLLMCDKKVVWAGLVFGVAILMKPQALMAGPLFAVAYLMYVIDSKDPFKAVGKSILAVLAAVAAIIVPSLPFWGTQEPKWLIDKYFSTVSSYNYATIEAYNLFGLLGANWRNADQIFLFSLSYKQWGTMFMALSIVVSAVLYIIGRKKHKHCLILTMGFLFAALFMFGHFMHERYLFPVLLFIAAAFVLYNDKRLFLSLAVFTSSLLINVLGAYIIVSNQDARGNEYNFLIIVGSILNLLGFAYLAYTCFDIMVKGRINRHFLIRI